MVSNRVVSPGLIVIFLGSGCQSGCGLGETTICCVVHSRNFIDTRDMTVGICLRTATEIAVICAFVIPLIMVVFVQPTATYAASSSISRDLGMQGKRLTLPVAVSIALERNRRIVEARMTVQEKEHEARSAFSDFLPTVDVQYTSNFDKYRNSSFVQELAFTHDSRRAFPTIPQEFPLTDIQGTYPYRIDPYRFFNLTATITQPIYMAGRTLNEYKYARLGVDYSVIQEQLDRQDLILDVYQAYYGLMRAQKLLDVAERSIAALEAFRKRAKAFYEAKVLPKLDLLSAEVQLASARKQKIQSLTSIKDQRAQLNFLMRLPLDTPTEIHQDYAYKPGKYKEPEIYDIAVTNRLELRQAGISVDQARALVKISESSLLPSVLVQLQGARSNDDWNVFDPEGVNSWRIFGVLNWTFDMFRQRETVKERKVSEAKAFTARDQLVDEILNEVGRAYRRMKRTESDIEENRAAVVAGEEAFRIARERYQGLLATYTEVLDAERRLTQSLGDYYASLIDLRIDEAALERVLGTLRP